MKTCLIIPLLVLFCSVLNGQQVIATAGSTLSNSDGSISFTIGEGITQAFTRGDKVITQGFQQPNLMVSIINEFRDINFKISAYPNPTTDILNVSIEEGNNQRLLILLFDFNGKLFQKRNIETSKIEIAFRELPNGIYILKIYDGIREIKSFKIIKE